MGDIEPTAPGRHLTTAWTMVRLVWPVVAFAAGAAFGDGDGNALDLVESWDEDAKILDGEDRALDRAVQLKRDMEAAVAREDYDSAADAKDKLDALLSLAPTVLISAIPPAPKTSATTGGVYQSVRTEPLSETSVSNMTRAARDLAAGLWCFCPPSTNATCDSLQHQSSPACKVMTDETQVADKCQKRCCPITALGMAKGNGAWNRKLWPPRFSWPQTAEGWRPCAKPLKAAGQYMSSLPVYYITMNSQRDAAFQESWKSFSPTIVKVRGVNGSSPAEVAPMLADAAAPEHAEIIAGIAQPKGKWKRWHP